MVSKKRNALKVYAGFMLLCFNLIYLDIQTSVQISVIKFHSQQIYVMSLKGH